jgi:hypothetical protein
MTNTTKNKENFMKKTLIIAIVAITLGLSAAPKKSDAAVIGIASGYGAYVGLAAFVGLPCLYTFFALIAPLQIFDGIYGKDLMAKTFGYASGEQKGYGLFNTLYSSDKIKTLSTPARIRKIFAGIAGLALITLDDNKQSIKFQPISSQNAIKVNITKEELTSWNDNIENLNGITAEIAEESKHTTKEEADKIVTLGAELIGDYGISAQDFKNIRSVLSKQMK